MENLNILIVEDVPIIMAINKRMIQKLGYEPDCATTAEEALQLFDENIYHLVITDIGLPEMNGDELMFRLRKYESRFRPFTSRIYALTAYDLIDVKKNCLNSGANNVFNKPLTIDLISKMIDETTMHFTHDIMV
jgi:CheY-like chemotaxis protein